MSRTLAWLVVVTLAVCWVALAYWFPPIGFMVGSLCLVCAFIDMGMNGARYAEFAPFNLTVAAIGFGAGWMGTP